MNNLDYNKIIITFSINIYLFYFSIPILFILGIISSNIHQKTTGEKDDSIIVIDEVVGQLIAMLCVGNNISLIITSFVLFRIFDILKPWPASYIDKNINNGLGVMLDDVFAGIYVVIVIMGMEYLFINGA